MRAARRVVTDAVGDVLPEGELEGVLLATSEVVTNAVEHGAPPIELRIEKHGGRIPGEVRASSPLPPRFDGEEPDPMEVRGRGMLIVDRCSDRWGVEPYGEDGKAVWFEVDVGAPNDSTPPR